nr:TonB-dependent receptor plug domain-containing protein [Sphingomonas xinjiangensis]
MLAGTCSGAVEAQQVVAPPIATTPKASDRTGAPAIAPSPARETPSAPAGDDEKDIVVLGGRPRASALGDIPPERVFRSADIRAFGADDVEALLGAIGAQTTSNRGRGDEGPVTLLNGRRVSSFSEIARIPAEAIERMEILPEEVALKYGYRADQKVVNVVTFQRYQAGIGEAGLLTVTRGNRTAGDADADFLRIRDDTRLGLGASYTRSTWLTEHDRDVRQLSGPVDAGRFRTLLPSTEQFLLNGLVSGHVLGEVSATVNGRFEANRSRSLLGLGEDGPLRRDSDQDAAHLGTTLGGRTGNWQWTAIGNYDRVASKTRTNLGDRSGLRDTAKSTDAVATADLILSGPIVTLPAGPLYTSVRGEFETHDFESRSGRSLASARSDIGRDRGGLQATADVPLLGSADPAASRVGRLSANASVAVNRLSDAGSLWTFDGGLTWSPTRSIGVILSGTSEQGAPTLEQLGGPALKTPNVRTFDLARGEVVDVTQLFGGNPRLRNDERHVFRVGMNVRPLTRTDLTLSLDYVAAQVDDPIVAFPLLSPQIEAAFPDRFVRDATGRLLQIDARPVNLAASRQKQLRWGVNWTRPLGAVPSGMESGMIRIPAAQAGQMTAGPNGTFTFRPEPGSALARNIMTASSRLFVSLYHNWVLEDSLSLRDELPSLDLLDGGAIDVGGGRRRHAVEFQAGVFKRGLGARLSATWQSGTEIGGSHADPDRLRFESLTTVNLNLFANLAERFGGASGPTWLKGTRVSFDIANLLDARSNVRDRLGATPLSYQAAYLDPLGRTISLRLRRVF